MTFVKLREPGDAVTMTVERVARSDEGSFPELVFYGANDDGDVAVGVPYDTAIKQLVRLELTESDAVGRVLTISRSQHLGKNGHPFWNVDVVGAAPKPASRPKPQVPRPAPTPAATAPAAPRPVAPGKSWDGIFATLGHCVTLAHGRWGKRLSEDGVLRLAITAAIEGNRAGLTVPQYDAVPAAIAQGEDEDSSLPF